MQSSNSTHLLKIPSQNGSPINEYRVHKGQVEFRSIDSLGKPYAYDHGLWRTLDARDLELHFALNTPVAQWLVHRLENLQAKPHKSPAAPLDST